MLCGTTAQMAFGQSRSCGQPTPSTCAQARKDTCAVPVPVLCASSLNSSTQRNKPLHITFATRPPFSPCMLIPAESHHCYGTKDDADACSLAFLTRRAWFRPKVGSPRGTCFDMSSESPHGRSEHCIRLDHSATTGAVPALRIPCLHRPQKTNRPCMCFSIHSTPFTCSPQIPVFSVRHNQYTLPHAAPAVISMAYIAQHALLLSNSSPHTVLGLGLYCTCPAHCATNSSCTASSIHTPSTWRSAGSIS